MDLATQARIKERAEGERHDDLVVVIGHLDVGGAARPGPPARGPLRGVSALWGSVTAFFGAQGVGLFARHGLDVEIPLLSGVKSVQVLIARQAEYGLISARTAVDARLAGAE